MKLGREFFLALGFFVAPLMATEPVVLSGRAMGTRWTVKFFQSNSPLNPASLHTRISEKLEQLEQQFSTYRPTSELSRFNAAKRTEWIAVSPEIARVAAAAQALSQRTGGAFDVTVSPLVQLWGFGTQRRASPPSAQEIAIARALVDWRRLEARQSPPALRKTQPDLSADFSSMAKGFAVDELAEQLLALGVAEGWVQIGGDIKTVGARGWRAGIASPGASGSEPAATAQTLELVSRALSTSGDANNFFQYEGRRYGHIIDPRTGEPVHGELAAVSVLDGSCATSSAWATTLFVLGAEQGFTFAVRERIAALFIVRAGEGLVLKPTPEWSQVSLPGGR
jgi:thiamine biosynthesis lipoprotein